jgi:FtsP/CotA-like multicopper oxidase with cupredoxin domain
MINRRDAVKLGAVAGAVLALPVARGVAEVAGTPATVTPFERPLPIPPVLRPAYASHTGDHYELRIMPGTARILPGRTTPVLTYNGLFPGPTIRARRGRPTTVRVTNAMATPAVVHLHGGNVPHDSDGQPMDPIDPGQSRTYTYPNIQPAATLWYHDHAHHLEAEQLYRGLAGLYLLDDPKSATALPSGRFDVPLMLRDAGFADNGEFLWAMFDGPRRNTVLVNGAPQPNFQAQRRKYRLRLLNCANERVFTLKFDNGAPFDVVASDGGLLAKPVRLTEVTLFPAERVEAVVDFSRFPAGAKLVLRNSLGNADANTRIMQFEVTGSRWWDAADRSDYTVPATLATLPPRRDPVATRRIEFGFDAATNTFLINGKAFDPQRVDFTVKRGSTELWEIHNNDTAMQIPHSMHVHLVQFRVLDRDGVAVPDWQACPKDTTPVLPGQTVRILVTFDSPYTGIFPFHCHFVDHSSSGMMGQFEIVP